jgi:hypothetical protein
MMSLCFYYAETAILRLVRFLAFIAALVIQVYEQLSSDSAFVDPKIRFRIPAKANLALKYLRNKLAVELSERIRNRSSTESQDRWMEMAFTILGKLQHEQSNRSQSIVLDIIVH